MAASEQPEHDRDLTDPSAPDAGDLLDVKTRSVQKMNGSENCLCVNLSELGATVLGTSKSDDVRLAIYNNGIWIPKDD